MMETPKETAADSNYTLLNPCQRLAFAAYFWIGDGKFSGTGSGGDGEGFQAIPSN
jgi:hypothetical protein